MSTTLLAVGLAVAVLAAARSTYSPCGLSMLSSITPFGERGRRHRYWVTATWYLAGATVGGLVLGGAGALMALVLRGAGLVGHPAVGLAIAAVLAGAAAAVDGGVFGPVLPVIRRQVDDAWLARYRPWFYGAGFGWQIGVGLATYLMTAGVVLVVLLGGLSASPVVALVLGAVFGAARGSTVFLTARAGAPARLRDLHAALDRVGPLVRRWCTGLQVAAAVTFVIAGPAGAGGWGPAGAAAAGAGVTAAGLALAALTGLGAGDRACDVDGSGAATRRPDGVTAAATVPATTDLAERWAGTAGPVPADTGTAGAGSRS